MLSSLQKQIHEKAVAAAELYRRTEIDLIQALQEVDQTKLYRKLNHSSLFKYAVEELGLSEATAYCFIGVARKGRDVPELMNAVKQRKISASKANRIVSSLTKDNAQELIEFAVAHSSGQIDAEMARRDPKAARKNKVKYLSQDLAQVEITLSRITLEKLKRAQELEGSAGLSHALDAVLDVYLKQKDPVMKAERALNRGLKNQTGTPVAKSVPAPSSTRELCSSRVNRSRRVSLTAGQKHQVIARDQGRCTHIGHDGKRCETERWLHIHHVKPVSLGGTNDPANLTTLCSFHHDLVHQLSLPLEGQVTWLRTPRAVYL
jgi:hypothetical protein